MKLALVLAGLLLLASAAESQAAGVGLRWDACYGEGTGTFIKQFACDTNAGSERLVGSFVSAAGLSNVIALEVAVDVSTGPPPFAEGGPRPAPPPLPAWWTFRNSGSCRQSALSVDFSPDPANQICTAWEMGQLLGTIANYRLDFPGPGTARVLMGVALGLGAHGSVSPDTEYAAFTLIVAHANTVGTTACSGCTTPLTITVRALQMVTPIVFGEPSRDVTLSGPFNGTDSDFAFWQGVPRIVPTRSSTWGAVKALYR